MLKIEVAAPGPPEALMPVEVESPRPEEGEVVVRAEAIGVNFADVWARLGVEPGGPTTPGIEVAGVVAASTVAEFRVGERVVATPFFTRDGYAQELRVPADLVFRLPDDVEPAVAAALPVNYVTAYGAVVEAARIRAGDRVLVASAAGGVGIAAVQLARHHGADVYATASREKHDALADLGVAASVDSRSPSWPDEVVQQTDGGVDVVVDGVGEDGFRSSLSCLRYGGRVVAYGFTAGVTSKDEPPDDPEVTLGRMSLPLLDLFDRARGFVTADGGGERKIVARRLDALFELLRAGRIAPRIDRVLPLRQAAAAHHRLQDRANVGKILLDPRG